MSRQDDNIFKCAKRMVDKMEQSDYYKLNGEFPKPVQIEINRMKIHCRDEQNQKALYKSRGKSV